MNRMAIQALEKMETRKFKAKVKGQREASCGASDSLSSSSTSDCAICLEKYIDGEVIFFSTSEFFTQTLTFSNYSVNNICLAFLRSIPKLNNRRLYLTATVLEIYSWFVVIDYGVIRS